MSDKQQVRFIRRNGRIIPIRPKKDSGKTPTAKLIAGSLAADLTASGLAMAATKSAGGNKGAEGKALMGMRMKYAAEVKQARGFKFKVGSDRATLSMLASLNEGQATRTVFSRGTEGAFAHELAHAIKSKQKGSANYKLRREQALLAKEIRRTKKVPHAKLFAKQLVRPLTILPAEFEATRTAFKMLNKKNGIVGALKKSTPMLLGQASYLGKAAGAVLAIGALGSFAYNVARGK